MENPWLRKNQHKADHGTKAEVLAAKRLGGKLTIGSGNKSTKGDFEINVSGCRFKVENKSTMAGSMSLKLDWLIKISQEARELGMTPALALQFVNAQGAPVKDGKWVLITEDQYKRLLGDEL